ncbi:hypothetical protein NBRC116586_31060 [Pseudooceanicola nitratireducens]|uniref:hypothetical protein n=1 Tax=Pseudooceanicola nitratireducens TaxID=517719 RepID=UPI00310B181A
MERFPWDDDAISKPARNATNDLPRSLSASDLAALGLPVDDPFWLSPQAFDAHLAEVEGQQAAQAKTLGPNAPAAQNIRMASPCRAPLPSLDPRKKGPAMTELPEAVRRAVEIIATPHAPDDQAIGAAAYLLKWYQAEYHCLPTLKGIVLWWWKAARRSVDIKELWEEEFRVLWRTEERPNSRDPLDASVNALFGHVSYRAARTFIHALGHHPDDDIARVLLMKSDFVSKARRPAPLKGTCARKYNGAR